MAMQFECPSCGASVRIRKGTDQMECSYCGSTIHVPREMQGLQVPGTTVTPSGRSCTGVAVIAAAAIILGVVGVVVFLATGDKVRETVETAVTGSHGTTGGDRGPVPVLEFGGEGMTPGRFEDPRNIAVDAAGNIYVGEYTGGRTQVFDPDGEYLTEWDVKGENIYVGGMDCSRDGIVYMAYQGGLHVHDGMSGELLDVLEWGEHGGFEDVCVATDGSIVAAWNVFEDNIIRFTSQGEVDLVIPDAISGRTGDSELQTRVAVDAAGTVYAMGTFNSVVVSYDDSGRYLDRFGSDEDVPGGFTAPQAITTDVRGRVLISDFDGVMVYDGTGLYLQTIPVNGFVFGMDVDDDNLLYTVSGDCMVYVFDLDEILRD